LIIKLSFFDKINGVMIVECPRSQEVCFPRVTSWLVVAWHQIRMSQARMAKSKSVDDHRLMVRKSFSMSSSAHSGGYMPRSLLHTYTLIP